MMMMMMTMAVMMTMIMIMVVMVGDDVDGGDDGDDEVDYDVVGDGDDPRWRRGRKQNMLRIYSLNDVGC